VKRNDRLDALASVPLFAGVKRKALRAIDADLDERRFTAGSNLTTQGTLGVAFFIITEGEAEVSVDGQPVQRLGPGDHFGEIALIAQSARTASVTATTDMRCLVLSEWKFRELVKRDPDLSWTLLETLAKQFVGQ
jgi:CRP/FNR family transcriptional regulator, cyclic AMP receptor protein